MGSKRWMLRNGLAELIHSRVSQHERFVDLFCGSSAVSWHVARNHSVPVLASDLQEFCRVLAAAVICRTGVLRNYWIDSWIDRATASAPDHPLFEDAKNVQHWGEGIGIVEYIRTARELCSKGKTPITAAYGGHYFSPLAGCLLRLLASRGPSTAPTPYGSPCRSRSNGQCLRRVPRSHGSTISTNDVRRALSASSVGKRCGRARSTSRPTFVGDWVEEARRCLGR